MKFWIVPVLVGRRGEEFLVVERPLGQGLVVVTDDDDFFELVVLDDVFEKLVEDVVDDDVLIAGVLGDVGDVAGMQAQVERVEHAAAADDPEVALEMPVVIPGQCGDAVALLHAELLERLRELSRALVILAVGVAVLHLARQQ